MLKIICALFLASGTVQATRVCKNWADYYWPLNPNCHDDPAGRNNITQQIKSWKFTAEEHYVITDDGYRILVERSYLNITKPSPVVIAHGVLMNGYGFTLRGNKSLAYVLGALGYDVWLINFRGTKYSLGHESLNNKQLKFWNFTLDHLGLSDTKYALDMVYKKTNKKAIYIGYSMGVQAGVIYSSSYPEQAKKRLQGLIGLAPPIYYFQAKTYAKYLIPFMPLIMKFIDTFNHGVTFDNVDFAFRFCAINPVTMYTCQRFLSFIFGDDYTEMDPTTYPLFVTGASDVVCIRILNHFFQIGTSGKFQHYDYGSKGNMQLYGQTEPLLYKLEKIPVPVSLWVGPNDWVATEKSARLFLEKLPKENRCKLHMISWKKWNHLDFTEAKDIQKLLFNDLVKVIDKLSKGTCDK